MEIFVTVALVAALRLAVPLVRFVRSRPALVERFTRRDAAPEEQPMPSMELGDERSGAAELTVEWGLFTEAFVQGRLAALARELERLDDDDTHVFAKGFHTMVVRSAYESLLSDAAKFASQPWRPTAPMLDVEPLGPSGGGREELWV